MKQQDGKVKLGLIGVGGHGKTIQRATEESELFDVIGVFDINPDEAAAAAERFDAQVAPDLEGLLSMDGLEAVAIVSPNFVHYDQVMRAFEHNLHVFVDKPISANVEEGLEMVRAGERVGKLLMVGHNMRYGPASRAVKQMIDEGKIGEVVTADVHFSADNTHRMPSDAWRLDPEKCHMLPVMQLGIHGLDLIHYYIGIINQVHASARAVTTRPEVVDSVVSTFRTENGVLGTMTSNYCSQVDFSIYLAGTKGNIRCTPHKVWYRSNADTNSNCEGPAEVLDFLRHPTESYVLEMVEFGEAIRGKKELEADGWVGLRALAVVEAMGESIRTGNFATIPAYPAVEVS